MVDEILCLAVKNPVIDAVDGSHHRHRDVRNLGSVADPVESAFGISAEIQR